MNDYKIIDGHSHIGIDEYWKNEGILDEYIKNLRKLGINETFLMSVPCPVIKKSDGTNIILSSNELINNEIKHFRIIEKDGKKDYLLVRKNQNPYKEANEIIYNACKGTGDIKINYVPIIHPYYYSIEDLVEQKKKGAKMFKIHGIAAGVIPEKIGTDFFEAIEKLEVPLIIHTDYSEKDDFFSSNNAMHWLKVLEPYNIKVYFAHAARLIDDAIDIINNDNRFLVGLGPTMLLSTEEYKTQNVENYIDYCFDHFDINKVVFDIDYPWNIISKNNFSLDWSSLDLIRNKTKEQDKVLSKNLINFLGGKYEKN